MRSLIKKLRGVQRWSPILRASVKASGRTERESFWTHSHSSALRVFDTYLCHDGFVGYALFAFVVVEAI